ncbi:KIN17-like protein [Pycnococcus provasolii]
MGKGNDVGGLKAIAKGIKAKGLQKLRWYCQACEKQCRDENGFQNHCESASHLRAMANLRSNPGGAIQQYSEEFLRSFLAHLRHAHRHTRLLANHAYNEFIGDRHHVHMNSTRWTTLSEFVQYLGKEGLCTIDYVEEKGWYIKYVDHADPFANLNVNVDRAKKETVAETEAREARQLALQVQRARTEGAAAAPPPLPSVTKIVPTDVGPVRMQLATSAGTAATTSASAAARTAVTNAFLAADEADDDAPSRKRARAHSGGALAAIMREEEEEEARRKRHAAAAASAQPVPRDCWLRKGIVVKLVDSSLASLGYQGAKADVVQWDASSPRVARVVVVSLRNTTAGSSARIGATLEVSQTHCETVLPAYGGSVVVVNRGHKYAGRNGTLISIDEKAFEAIVRIPDVKEDVRVSYDDVSKVCA